MPGRNRDNKPGRPTEGLGFCHDRIDAGRQLAQVLSRYRGKNALVVGIPRGGLLVAQEVARGLDADLDVIVARKLPAPGDQEVALGAVAADGAVWIDRQSVRFAGVSDATFEKLEREQRSEASRREARLRAGLPAVDPAGRVVIVVDDGLATGATMRAVIRSLRTRDPARIVVAVPVGAAEVCDNLAHEVDEFVCLYRPQPFYAVADHYQTFAQASDDEVEQALREQWAVRHQHGSLLGPLA